MAIDLLKESNELQNSLLNSEIFDLVLKEFVSQVEIPLSLEKYDNPEEKVENLKLLYIYMSEYIDLFFEILKKKNYNMKDEIKKAAWWLMNLPDYNENKELIEKLLHSPVIQDVSFGKDHKFRIYSEEFGEFVFQPAIYYFADNNSVLRYIKNNRMSQNCHNNTYFLSKLFENFYSITSLCTRQFLNCYHHSYTYNPYDDTIIDLSYKAVYEKNSFYNIFEPIEISRILNSEVEKELEFAILNTEQPERRCELLKIALYKEYLQKIGYTGAFEDAPMVL